MRVALPLLCSLCLLYRICEAKSGSADETPEVQAAYKSQGSGALLRPDESEQKLKIPVDLEKGQQPDPTAPPVRSQVQLKVPADLGFGNGIDPGAPPLHIIDPGNENSDTSDDDTDGDDEDGSGSSYEYSGGGN